jgi:hypothetical protein
MVPNPTTKSTATVSPFADAEGAGLVNFSDLSPEQNAVFTAALNLNDVIVPIPGAEPQRISFRHDWRTEADALQAMADAQLQQRTYPIGDPLWVHFETVIIAARQFIDALDTVTVTGLTSGALVQAAVQAQALAPTSDLLGDQRIIAPVLNPSAAQVLEAINTLVSVTPANTPSITYFIGTKEEPVPLTVNIESLQAGAAASGLSLDTYLANSGLFGI